MSLQEIPGCRLHGPVGSALRVVLGCGRGANGTVCDGLSSYEVVSVASCCAAASKFVPILPLIWTMSWDSRFHTVCVGLDGTYVPNTLSNLRFSPTTMIRWRSGERVLPIVIGALSLRWVSDRSAFVERTYVWRFPGAAAS